MPSKNVHIVTASGTFQVPNDPSSAVAGACIDSALELSKKYGRNIRQGNSFRLIGYGLQLKVPGQDTGAAAVASLNFVEPNRHLVKAWNNSFKQWRKQKQIEARVGKSMRYDDFELALKQGYVDGRTSHIYDNPFDSATGDQHDVGLTGNSDESGNYTSISDVYTSRFNPPSASESHFGNTIKSAKFGSEYLDITSNIFTSLVVGATASGGVDVGSTPDALGWGVSMQDMVWLPADNHINVMCGLVEYQIRAFPEDTLFQLADSLHYQITLVYEGWSPLADSKKGGKK